MQRIIAVQPPKRVVCYIRRVQIFSDGKAISYYVPVYK